MEKAFDQTDFYQNNTDEYYPVSRALGETDWYKNLDRSSMQAYEKFVMASFENQSEKEAEAQRKAAIESLIPGTINYYHLFFVDLLRKKPNPSSFTKAEKELFTKFEHDFGSYPQFTEIDCLVKFSEIPETLTEKSSDKDTQQMLHAINFVKEKFMNDYYDKYPSVPTWLKDQHEDSSHSEDEGKGDKAECTFDFANAFDRKEKIDKIIKGYTSKSKIDNHFDISGYEDDLDWTKFEARHVFDHAEWIISNASHNQFSKQFYEIESDSFFSQIAKHFAEKYKEAKKHDKTAKYSVGYESFYDKLTIEQLDKFNALLQKQGFNVLDEEESFVSAYFSKVFSNELLEENQETMTNREKFDTLKRLYDYCQTKKLPKSLISNLLHEILVLSIKLDDYQVKLFKDYLQLPLEKNHNLKKKEVQASQSISNYQKWNKCLGSIQQNTKQRYEKKGWYETSEKEDIIPSYLTHIAFTHPKGPTGSLKEFSNDFEDQYLNEFERKMLVYKSDKGMIDLEKQVDPAFFKQIADEVFIKFKESNQERFTIDEAVVLLLSVKNVPELRVKVFEFNTETYYKKTMKPFDTSINLHGMVPTIEKSLTNEFQNVPKNKITEVILNLEELKGKVGLFIVELFGNGIMSRAVIKKGSLTLITRSIERGHLVYILDEKKQICVSDKTGIWFEKEFFKCDPEKKGAIFIPYGPHQQQSQVIMIHENFAQLSNFTRNTENFTFEAFYHVNTEQFIEGFEAQVVIRPKLLINGQKATLTMLKNASAVLNIDSHNNSQVRKRFDNLNFTDGEETVISFQVPVQFYSLKIELNVEVFNKVQDKMQSFNSSKQLVSQASFSKYFSSPTLKDMYLKRDGDKYFLHVLGKNGDPWAAEQVTVVATHKDFSSNPLTKALTTDKQGKICLGTLKNINNIRATQSDGSTLVWHIINEEKDSWTQSKDIHVIENETIEIPVNFDGSKPLSKLEASLVLFRNNTVISNMFKRIQVIKDASGIFHCVVLNGLEVGQYVLKTKFCSNELQNINIQVHKGQIWQESFILKKNCILKSTAQKKQIRIGKCTASPQEDKTKLTIELQNSSSNSRVHVYAQQFLNTQPDEFRDQIEHAVESQISMSTFPFAKWTNMFQTNHDIGDEIRYVLKRQKLENQLGNTLDKPTLLMQRNYLRDTTTNRETLRQTQNYQQYAMEGQEIGHGEYIQENRSRMMTQNVAPMMKEMKMAKKKICKSEDAYLGSNNSNTLNQVKFFQQFLKFSPLQVFNLKPNQNGIVETTLEGLSNFSILYVVACDKDSVVSRNMSVNGLLKDVKGISTKDLTQQKHVSKEKVGLTINKEVICVNKGDFQVIEDVQNTKIQIVDNAEMIHTFMQEHNNYSQDGFTQLIKSLLLKWESMKEEDKLKNFSKYSSHQLNFFIFKKDKPFFDQVVVPYIQNKLEKTFIDWYLLASDQPSGHPYVQKVLAFMKADEVEDQLDILERCLLLQTCLLKGDEMLKAQATNKINVMIAASKIEEVHSMSTFESKFDQLLNSAEVDKNQNIDLLDLAEEAKNEMAFAAEMVVTQSAFMSMPSAPMMRSMPMQSQIMSRAAPRRQVQNDLFNQRNYAEEAEYDDDFGGQYGLNYQENLMNAPARIACKQLESTKEYMETHYYKSSAVYNQHRFNSQNMAFLNDYMKYVVAGDYSAPFLSKNFLLTTLDFLPFLISLQDLPLNKQKSNHKFTSAESRGIKITASSNLIMFLKDITESSDFKESDIVIKHRYFNYNNQDRPVTDFQVNKPYLCQIIVSNLSDTTYQNETQTLIMSQVPEGSIPILTQKYTQDQKYTLGAYQNIKAQICFYFPSAGKFMHSPSNASIGKTILALSQEHELNVGKTIKIKEVQTFEDLMLSTKGLANKKQKILELCRTKSDLMTDPKFKFGEQFDGVMYLLHDDLSFYIDFMKIMAYIFPFFFEEIFSIAFQKREEILAVYKTERPFIMKLIKTYLTQKQQSITLSNYYFRPANFPFMSVTSDKLFNEAHKHLEYFPIVNQRVYSIGGQEYSDASGQKEILNMEFKQTYQTFIHLLCHHQEVIPKHKLQLAYFLQLQDRVGEAIKVFDTIDRNSISQDQGSVVAYDYMHAYFDFFRDTTQKFQTARVLANKYKNYPLFNFRKMFNKIEDQLIEIDSAGAETQVEFTDEKEKVVENAKKKTPQMHEVTVKANGEVEIESDNVDHFIIKYYLIDAEILFSRSPFIQDQAEQFSYVKPYHIVDQKAAQPGQPTLIPLPEMLNGKNVVIEISTEGMQRFKTFYSSTLKVKFNEQFGELKVFNGTTMKPMSKVYVKVFCKETSGNEIFYRDGFTDIRGKFEYAQASGQNLNDVNKFSILVSHPDFGQIIKEVGKPKTTKE